MTIPDQPRLRRVESFPVNRPEGEVVFAFRDPEGFSDPIVIPYAAAVLASLMDGSRTLAGIQVDYQQRFGQSVALAEIEGLVRDLDDRLYLDTDRFRARWKSEIEFYLNSRSRPAAHAGQAYAGDAEELKEQLAALFTGEKGPGAPVLPSESSTAGSDLLGVLSPHIDLQRGGIAFAYAYKHLVEQSDADLFVIFGTGHNPMRNLFSVSRKDFETPLGTVETDRQFVARLTQNLAVNPGGRELNLAADELAGRQEHSIEFQAVFLQYLLGGKRPFKIVPVLTGSFHELITAGRSPSKSPEVAAFVAAMRKTAEAHPGRVCYISGGDLAHVGQRFGDREFLDAPRLAELAEDDRRLLAKACEPDAEGFFQHVATAGDCHRICGLSPTYTMLEVIRPGRGELLKYDQAVELDGTACVSFASAAFYRD
ncbi:MAG: AmmeMemoRadiSam system protein B [Planctomycetota bacterium]|nr:MAG: AmmeMemoRadiSam system protein B [Planctomycetota bacterium]